MSALGLFNDSLAQYASLNAALQKTASEAATMATAAAGSARSTEKSQTAFQQTAVQAAAQIDGLTKANAAQRQVWETMGAQMKEYQLAFTATIDSRII